MTSECLNCGEVVSDSFARVFGDNEDKVHGCYSCTKNSEMRKAAGME